MNDLELALDELKIDPRTVGNLLAAYELSEARISQARRELKKALDDVEGLDVIAFGSLARHEMTAESDLDFLIITDDDTPPEDSARAVKAADALRKSLGGDELEIRAPGSSGVFGTVVKSEALVKVIGLQDDTNHTHTRRILFLEESVSLLGPDRHLALLETIIGRYQEAKPLGKTKVPRFLLNDLARYWRTLTIDYQAKAAGTPTHLRYLKLIVSRKFTFFTSIFPLMIFAFDEEVGPSDPTGDRLAEKLRDIYAAPPIVRFLRAWGTLRSLELSEDIEEELLSVLAGVETFNGLLGDGPWRAALIDEAAAEHGTPSPHFEKGQRVGQELQRCLEEILFSKTFLPLTKKYLVL